MAKSYEELKNEISAITNEVEDGANTANRIGGAMADIADFAKEVTDIQSEETDNKVSELEASTEQKFKDLVVQETGDGEGVVMSQKAVTEKLTELESEVKENTNVIGNEAISSPHNLIDIEIVEQGHVIDRFNDENPSEGVHVSISVKQGDIYLITAFKYSASSVPLFLFRKNGKVVQYDMEDRTTGLNKNVWVITPGGVDELIINSNIITQLYCQKYQKVMPFALDDGNELRNTLIKANILVPTIQDIEIQSGVLEKSNVLNTGVGVHVSISVKPNERYIVNGYKFNNQYPVYLFRNKGNVISFETELSNTIHSNIDILVPYDVDELIVNANNSNNLSVSKYEENKDNDKTLFFQKIPLTIENNVLDRWNGATTEEGIRTHISVKEGEHYVLNGFFYNKDYPCYLFRKAGVIVSYFVDLPSGMPFGNLHVIIPGGVDEMVVNSNVYFLEILKGIVTKSEKKSCWEGKKILWLGTSIPEKSTYTPGGNYPEQVANALGAEIRNVALGSSMARKGYLSRVSENDEMGITGVGFITASRALGMSIVEKEDLINNWDSKWDALVTGGTHGALSDSDKTLILSASYENKLKANLEWADLVVLDHGRNDYSGNNADNTIGENFYDMRTFQGAMNTYIKMILEARKKVVMISHYETQQFPNLIKMQQEVADYWGVPFFRLCDKLCWAYNRTISLPGFWQKYGGGGYYWSEDGVLREYRLTAANIPDGTHPNTDLSGVASRTIAQKIIPFINQLGETDL